MHHLHLNGQRHPVPARWAELTPAQLLAAAPYLPSDTAAHRLALLRAWCPKVPARLLRRLTPDELWDTLALVGWVWEEEIDPAALTEFRHRGTVYLLPEKHLADAVLVEYAMAQVYFHQFARPQQPLPLALDQLVATLCRPAAANLDVNDPHWDGQRREKYNGKLAEARACALADAPLSAKIMVLHHFLAAQRFIHRSYKVLWRPAAPPVAGAPVRNASDGTETLELIADLAERGLYGTYDQVATTSLHTVFFNLAKQARRRREAEQE